MPARQDVPPLGLVEDPPFEGVQGGALEKGEIPWVVFLVIVEIHGLAHPDLRQVDVREIPVGFEAGDVEVDGAELLVGVPFLKQPARKIDHLLDMLAGLGVNRGGLDAEAFDIRSEEHV